MQVEYSPFVLDIEGPSGTDMLATARELGVAIVAYSPLGRGILTGSFTTEAISREGDYRAMFPMYEDENLKENTKLLGKLKALADTKECSLAQLAIAWLLKQGDVIPIPGTKRIAYLEENWGAAKVQLTDEEESAMRDLIKKAGVAGGRAPDWASDGLYVDTREE